MKKYILIIFSLFLFFNTYSQKDTLTKKRIPILIINPNIYSGYLGLGLEHPIKKHLNYYLNVNYHFMHYYISSDENKKSNDSDITISNSMNIDAIGFSIKSGFKYYYNCKNTTYSDGYFISPIILYKRINADFYDDYNKLFQEVYGFELLFGKVIYRKSSRFKSINYWFKEWYIGYGFRRSIETLKHPDNRSKTNIFESLDFHLGFIIGLDFNKYQ